MATEFHPVPANFPEGGDADDSNSIVWEIQGLLKPVVNLSGARLVRRPGVIKKIVFSLARRGSSGLVTVDINKHTPAGPLTTVQYDVPGTTIYTTQANRPSIPGDAANLNQSAILECALPDVSTFLENDFFTIDIDSGGTQARNLIIEIFVRYD